MKEGKYPFNLEEYSRNMAKIYFPNSKYEDLMKLPNGMVNIGEEMIKQFDAKSRQKPSSPNTENHPL